MCLYTHQDSPNIAQENIVVCKVLVVWTDGSLHSPYQQLETNWEFDKIYINSEPIEYKEYWGYKEFGKGFYHSYQNELACKDLIKYFNRKKEKLKANYEIRIYKAIIPKGTEYYTGQRSDICSQAIIIKNDFT